MLTDGGRRLVERPCEEKGYPGEFVTMVSARSKGDKVQHEDATAGGMKLRVIGGPGSVSTRPVFRGGQKGGEGTDVYTLRTIIRAKQDLLRLKMPLYARSGLWGDGWKSAHPRRDPRDPT